MFSPSNLPKNEAAKRPMRPEKHKRLRGKLVWKQCIGVRPFALPFYSLSFEMEKTRLAAVPLPYLSDTNITHILNAMKREK